jgi:hypothetical protein
MPTPRAFEWAIGQGSKETTFGVAQADGSMTHWLPVTEAAFADLGVQYRTDAEEINGFVGETSHQEESRSATVQRKMQASVESIAWSVFMMLGNVVSSGTTPNFTHVGKWRSICTVNPPSFSFVEGLICAGSTATYWLYKGSVVDQVTVEVSGKGFVQLTITVKTDGSETAKTSFTWPASAAAVNKLVGAMLTLKCGPIGTEDLTSLVRSFKFTLNAGVTEPPSIGNVLVTEYQYGGSNPTLEIEFTIKGDKSHTLYAAMQSGLSTGTPTNQKLDALLQVNANSSIRLFCSKGIANATVKPSGNETNLVVKYMPEHNVTDSGPAVITAKNAIASYLNAA